MKNLGELNLPSLPQPLQPVGHQGGRDKPRSSKESFRVDNLLGLEFLGPPTKLCPAPAHMHPKMQLEWFGEREIDLAIRRPGLSGSATH